MNPKTITLGGANINANNLSISNVNIPGGYSKIRVDSISFTTDAEKLVFVRCPFLMPHAPDQYLCTFTSGTAIYNNLIHAIPTTNSSMATIIFYFYNAAGALDTLGAGDDFAVTMTFLP